MAYTKNTWEDQNVERPRTYAVQNNQDSTITLTDSFGVVTTLGTPVNATNMNHIEDGIESCDTAITNLQSQVTTLDASVVKKTGDQTITGTKTFSTAVKVPNSSVSGSALALMYSGSHILKLGDGTMIQWGSGATSNYYTNIDMYQAFASKDDYYVFLTDTGGQTAVSSFKVIDYVSSTRFRVYGTAGGSSDTFKWLAIGKI